MDFKIKTLILDNKVCSECFECFEMCDEEDDDDGDEDDVHDDDDGGDGDILGSEASDLGHRRTGTVQNHHC